MINTLTQSPLKLVLILAIAIPSIAAGTVLVNASHNVEAAQKNRFAQVDQLD